VCAEAVGAYTGEVSAAMFRTSAVATLSGHSERRSMRVSALVARKFVAHGARADPHPVRGRAAGGARGGPPEVVGAQLDAVLELSGVRPGPRGDRL
jgi:hypothetical protein